MVSERYADPYRWISRSITKIGVILHRCALKRRHSYGLLPPLMPLTFLRRSTADRKEWFGGIRISC
jgi:hypothetical protein